MAKTFEHNIEPHAPLLRQPAENQLLYKIIKADDFLKSIAGNYLYFKRVDTYGDDTQDGEQLELDRISNATVGFAKDPTYTIEKYYDTSRSRTYASCFSLENSDYIWEKYGSGGKDAICLVFEFGKLRKMLNQLVENSGVMYKGTLCKQFFSINYGIIEYVDKKQHRTNSAQLPNPIQYTHLKDKQSYENEKELRVSLSTLGIGNFALDNAEIIQFPEALEFDFNFKKAFAEGVIKEIKYSNQFSADSLNTLLQRMEGMGFRNRVAS
jgi:hypothetical protein